MPEITMPQGYMQDTMGRLVPDEMVKEIDRTRHELVMDLVRMALSVNTGLKKFKEHAFTEIAAFSDLSAMEYGREYGGEKGNISLLSYDGKYKILRAVSDSFDFDERLQVAKGLIDECLREWGGEARPEIRLLINDAFRVDKKGNVNTQQILSLRKFNIKDARWLQAMEAINDSLTVAGSRIYLRVYERISGTDQWKQISLDIAGV
jgi:hypothetical protein